MQGLVTWVMTSALFLGALGTTGVPWAPPAYHGEATVPPISYFATLSLTTDLPFPFPALVGVWLKKFCYSSLVTRNR